MSVCHPKCFSINLMTQSGKACLKIRVYDILNDYTRTILPHRQEPGEGKL